jgi:hypothetical protein
MSAADVIVPTGATHAIINPSSCRRHGVMPALTLVADRQLVTAQMPAPRQVFGKIVVGFR